MPGLTPDEIERLLEAATQGKWLHERWAVYSDTGLRVATAVTDRHARLIAAAPSAIRSLLSRVRALEAALREISSNATTYQRAQLYQIARAALKDPS